MLKFKLKDDVMYKAMSGIIVDTREDWDDSFRVYFPEIGAAAWHNESELTPAGAFAFGDSVEYINRDGDWTLGVVVRFDPDDDESAYYVYAESEWDLSETNSTAHWVSKDAIRHVPAKSEDAS